MYDAVIREQLEKGIVQTVECPEMTNGNRIHYLPHHAIIRQDKNTTKLRVVYDASARADGPSLNDSLHVGPKFNQKILDILLRFRSHRVALTADIEKAFLMISVAEKDRDVLRFLWFENVFEENPEIRVMRFARVVFGVSSSPFLLNATVRHHLQCYMALQPELVRLLTQSIYVDDVICGAENDEDAFQFFQQSKQVMREGGFNLRKFLTNSIPLQGRINVLEGTTSMDFEDETYTTATLGSSQQTLAGEVKVLGVRWDRYKDQLVFDVHHIVQAVECLEPTKRRIMSTVSAIYDPIGILSPFVVRLKMFFQELCNSKLGWDDLLPDELLTKWTIFMSELQDSPSIRIPRFYLHGVSSVIRSYRLCGFSDASRNAYAAVVYLLLETDTAITVRLVAAKTRVSPTHVLTIPRLELLAALLLARLVSGVSKSLETNVSLELPMCWTDSKVALYWICGTSKSWKPFVQNRVNEIRRLVQAAQWKHCPGKTNPADLPSRGLSLKELANSPLCFNGPEWLTRGEIGEEIDPQNDIPEECVMELRSKEADVVHCLLDVEGAGVSNVLNIERFSSLNKLLRVTTHVLMFIMRLRRPTEPPTELSLYLRGEVLWILEAQSLLLRDKRMKEWKRQFGLFQDSDGIWRCGGRLTNANLPYNTKHPILLPSNHTFTTLIVKWAHNRVLHNGMKETLVELRTKYWVLRGRAFVKKIIHRCVVCRKFEAPHYRVPPPPPLPPFRVQEKPPFSFVGVDFAGPVYIKLSKCSEGAEKAWIVLYTCCVVRAVHLDVVVDLSTQAFIRSFKRFSARRGLPTLLVSDNGKTFKGASKLIKKIMSHETVIQHLMGLRIEWKFNLERAAWWGGVFERLIGSMKRCLRKLIGRATLTYDELLTAVTEVEMVINSRPISYVSSDDLEEPLTPSHLLAGRRILGLPDNLYYDHLLDPDFELNQPIINKRMRYLSRILDHFWKRWRSEYLLSLREQHKIPRGTTEKPQVTVGDIVLVHDDSRKRGFWNLGKVEEIISGVDGRIRGAVVTVYTGGRCPALLRRSIAHLYPLEINSEKVEESTQTPLELEPSEQNRFSPLNTVEPSTETQEQTRPKRKAAAEARDRIIAQGLAH